MSKIKVVIFDVGGVLVSWGKSMDDDLKEELQLDDEKLDIFRSDYLYALGRGEISEAELWKRAERELGIRPVKLEENLIGRAFAKTFNSYQEVINFVHRLKKRGIKVAVLSNTNPIHSETVRLNKIYEPFKDIFLSHEIGMRKPDPEIFEYVLNKLGVRPEEALFIDDQLENIEPAQRLGMSTVLAKDTQQIINDVEAVLK